MTVRRSPLQISLGAMERTCRPTTMIFVDFSTPPPMMQEVGSWRMLQVGLSREKGDEYRHRRFAGVNVRGHRRSRRYARDVRRTLH